ncbi:hypothetical protein [Qipengyuania sp. NPDC077563]|uniref:hypothetical protein n=1 Tax=Qipengyuania sp. NPDC077563 TaxID=3364497 RepID=UPI00384F3364
MQSTENIKCDEFGRDALVRFANARDAALQQSNRFLLFGIASSVFYAIKMAGLRIDIVIADTKIFETPYGLFIFGVVGAACFILAQLRYLDAEAFDDQLKKLASSSGPVEFRYSAFPSKHHWLSPANDEYGSDTASFSKKVAFACLALCVFALYVTPLFAAVHFLIVWPKFAGETYTDLQWWLVFGMLLASVLVYVLVQSLQSMRG